MNRLKFLSKSSLLNISKLILVVLFSLPIAGCGLFEGDDEKFKKLDARAKTFAEENKLEEARITLQSALQLKPKEANLHYRLAEVYIKQKRFQAGAQSYQEAINLNPNHRKANLHLGALYLVASKDDKAEELVQKLLRKSPNDEDAMALMANVHSKRKDFDKAEVILKQILGINRKNITALAGMADVSLARKDPKKAESFLKKALEVDPRNGPIQLAIVDLYIKQGRHDEAESLLKKLVAKDPSNTTLRYYLGEYLLTKGSSADSIEHFEATVKAVPKKHEARDRLFDVYLFNNKPKEAKALYASLEKASSKDPALPYFKGRVSELEGDFENAALEYNKALDTLGNFAPAHRRAGISEMRNGNTADGLKHLDKAITIDPHDVGARLALAQHSFRNKKLGAASKHVNQVLARYPFQVGANTLRADIALLEGDTETAEKIYKVLIENYPDSTSGYLKMGLLEEKKKNKTAALDSYLSAIKKDRNIWIPLQRFLALSIDLKGGGQTLLDLQELHANSKSSQAEYGVAMAQAIMSSPEARQDPSSSIEKAKIILSESIKANENFLPAYSLMAQLDTLNQDVDSSIASYRTLVEKKPDQHIYRLFLAMSLEKKGLFEEAAENYQSILAKKPRFGPAANNLAWIMVSNLNGDLDEALKLAQIAKEEMPKQSAVADTLGWIYHSKGSSKVALPYLEDAVKLEEAAKAGKVNPEILFHLGQVQKALENHNAAKQTFSRALEIGGPQFSKAGEIKKIIADLP